MTRFQDLLTLDAVSTLKSEQDRAILELPGLVRASSLSWWEARPGTHREARFLLIVVATYSHYDLAMLDLLNQEIETRGIFGNLQYVSVYVANLLDYLSIDRLTADISVITKPPAQTPIAALWENGGWSDHAIGKLGRDLVAGVLGLDPKAFNDQVIARVPKYTASA